MKKVFVTILSVLYLVTSSGATIDFHYCMGKFIGWDLSIPVNNKCSHCGMQKSNQKGCCNDEHATIQLRKDQLASHINLIPENSFKFIHTEYSSFVKNYVCAYAGKQYAAHSPPGSPGTIQPFVLNCVFRI